MRSDRPSPALVPHIPGRQQRFLHNIFGQLEALNAEDAGKDGDELARLGAKKVVGEAGDIARRSGRRFLLNRVHELGGRASKLVLARGNLH